MRKNRRQLLILAAVGVGAYVLYKNSSAAAANPYYGTPMPTGAGAGMQANWLQSLFQQFGGQGGGSPAFMPINYTGTQSPAGTGTGTAVA